jgi:hypothetical protein
VICEYAIVAIRIRFLVLNRNEKGGPKTAFLLCHFMPPTYATLVDWRWLKTAEILVFSSVGRDSGIRTHDPYTPSVSNTDFLVFPCLICNDII